LYKGGGTIFGPKPHGYDIKLNRKVKDLARISALSHKAKEKAIVVVEDINMDAPKTKNLMDIFGSLKVADKKLMFILPENNTNVQLSARNAPSVLDVLYKDMNVYDIVNSDVLVLTESAAKVFAEAEKAEA
jgi:large subunit ribosomal protein L4